MRLAIVALMTVALGVGSPCVGAQDTTRRKLAEELLSEMQMKETIEKSFAMFKKMMPNMMKTAQATAKTAMPPGETKADEDAKLEKAEQMGAKMMDLMAKEMSWDSMKDDYITLYAETFTEEELKGLVVFYKSPVGKAFVKKMPELMKRSMQMSQKKMMQWMPKIQELSKDMMEPPSENAKKATPPVAPKIVAPPPAPVASPPVAPPPAPPAVKP